MLLAVNIGNTYVSLALFDSSRTPLITCKISASKTRSSDEYAVLIKNVLDFKLSSDYNIDSVAISSIVPTLTDSIRNAGRILSGSEPYIIGPGTKTGFKISINDPASLGADIVANTAASLDISDGPLIIFDAGTANTITVVDENRAVTGVVIMPGLFISASALCNNAELLDPVYLNSTDVPLIGKTTDQSILAGLLHGTSIMLDGYVRNIRESILSKSSDTKPTLIATGTYAKLITDNCRNKFSVNDTLTLSGIASLYYKNIKQ